MWKTVFFKFYITGMNKSRTVDSWIIIICVSHNDADQSFLLNYDIVDCRIDTQTPEVSVILYHLLSDVVSLAEQRTFRGSESRIFHSLHEWKDNKLFCSPECLLWNDQNNCKWSDALMYRVHSSVFSYIHCSVIISGQHGCY